MVIRGEHDLHYFTRCRVLAIQVDFCHVRFRAYAEKALDSLTKFIIARRSADVGLSLTCVEIEVDFVPHPRHA